MKRFALLVLCLGLAASVRADFALRDGETLAFLGDNPAAKKLARQAKVVDDEIVALQRATAKPHPYRFEIKRVTAP